MTVELWGNRSRMQRYLLTRRHIPRYRLWRSVLLPPLICVVFPLSQILIPVYPFTDECCLVALLRQLVNALALGNLRLESPYESSIVSGDVTIYCGDVTKYCVGGWPIGWYCPKAPSGTPCRYTPPPSTEGAPAIEIRREEAWRGVE